MRRRSTSSFVSPGPRVPMPPPRRERSAPTPMRFDCRYRRLREFHLQLALAAARVPREDVENQHRPVDDRQRNDALQILALARPQVVEHQYERRAVLVRKQRDLGGLAAPDERRRDRRARAFARRVQRRSRRKHAPALRIPRVPDRSGLLGSFVSTAITIARSAGASVLSARRVPRCSSVQDVP